MNRKEQYLKQSLKQEATAFEINPPESAHSEIMRKVEIQGLKSGRLDKGITHSRKINWFLPMGATLTALILVMMNLPQSIESNSSDSSLENSTLPLQIVDLDDLSMRLETHLANEFKQEQEAIKKDLIYMKNLFLL